MYVGIWARREAAHTVHGLAGQGVNIGLYDAAALANAVFRAVDVGGDVGGSIPLRECVLCRPHTNA